MCHDESKSQNKIYECIIINQDELYIASNTLQEILHIVKDKYKIKINPNDCQGSNFPYDPGGRMIYYRQYMEIHKKFTYQHYISNFINPSITYISISLYTQETSYMKWKANTASWGVSIKINNENENYTLHFIFPTNILHIKFSWIHVMKNIKITYQLVRRQET